VDVLHEKIAIGLKLLLILRKSLMDINVGTKVYKISGEYQGPGIVKAIITKDDGSLRYLVGHTIEGGKGQFLHIYSRNNIEVI